MTAPSASSTLSSTLAEPARDILWGRPQFRAPSLDRLLAMLDFSAFASEFTRACGLEPKEIRAERTSPTSN